jgi:hypothetical protein
MEEEKKEQPEQGQSVKKAKKPIDLSKGGLLWTIWHLVEAILLVVGGVLAIVYSGNPDIQKIIYPVVGSFLILGGFLKILSNFLPVLATNDYEAEVKLKAKKAMAYDMVIGGSFELALGITLCVIYASQQSAIATITLFLSTFIAIILMVAGVSLLLFAIGFIVAKLYKLYLPILEIILGLALIALGVVVVIYMKDDTIFNRVVLIIVGVILVLGGLGMLVDTITAVRAANALKKAKKEGAAAPAADETVTASVSVTEVDFSTEEGKKAAPEKKPGDEKPSDDKK